MYVTRVHFYVMRTTIRLNDDLLRQAKRRAAEEGRTFSSLVEDGLRAVLRPQKQTRVKLPLSTAGGGVHPGIDLNSNASLQDLLDEEDGWFSRT